MWPIIWMLNPPLYNVYSILMFKMPLADKSKFSPMTSMTDLGGGIWWLIRLIVSLKCICSASLEHFSENFKRKIFNLRWYLVSIWEFSCLFLIWVILQLKELENFQNKGILKITRYLGDKSFCVTPLFD